ncbi:hypothetical protein F4808DRAFT_436447 [Astrocystis sublimbata]|nr:hypothetical protein F4808DRAFT_436447 [Astrocystis sublimbata]
MSDIEPCYCFERRCSFCRFELKPGEWDVVALINDDWFSDRFSTSGFVDYDGSFWIPCSPSCPHNDGKKFVCHVGCLEFATSIKHGRIMSYLLQYAFKPLKTTEKRRLQILESTFVSNFTLGTRSLPPELGFMIAQYCIRELAIAAVPTPMFDSHTRSIDVLRGLWARYVIIDGVRYYASLSDKPSAGAQLILSIDKVTSDDRLYVAEDHLGIRRVCFGNSTSHASGKRDMNLWWRTFAIHESAQLRVYSDGLKVRRLEAVSGDAISHLAKYVTWLVPEHRPDLVRFHEYCYRPQYHLRMAPFTCNDARTIGYSVCLDICLKSNICYLHAHTSGESMAFYEEVATDLDSPMWVYVPIDKGEYISQIWMCFSRALLAVPTCWGLCLNAMVGLSCTSLMESQAVYFSMFRHLEQHKFSNWHSTPPPPNLFAQMKLRSLQRRYLLTLNGCPFLKTLNIIFTRL